MLVDEYQAQAVASDQSKGRDTARYLLLGVFGEAGGLLTAVKKRERDAETLSKYLAQVTEEVGDLLWYLAAVAHRNGVMLSTLVGPLIDPPAQRLDKIQFSDLQPSLTRVSPEPSRTLELRLVRLASAIGDFVDAQTESLHTRTRSSSNDEFTAVFRWLESVASYVGVSLEDAAVENLAKVRDRWPPKKVYIPPFDDTFPEYERLPVPVFTWNVFPLHPHEQGNSLSNRCHSRAERIATLPVLEQLIDIIRPKRIIAIGNDAALGLLELGVDCVKVRHPSYGGVADFERGIAEIYGIAAESTLQSPAFRLL